MSRTQSECPGQSYDWGCLYLVLLFLVLHYHHPQLGRQCFVAMEKRCCPGAINFGQPLTCIFTLLLLLLFSCSVMSNSLWPHGLQQAGLPCPSLSPGFLLNSCPLSQWGYPTISSSAAPLLLLPSISPSVSFPMSRLMASGGQSTSVSASVLPIIQVDFI